MPLGGPLSLHFFRQRHPYPILGICLVLLLISPGLRLARGRTWIFILYEFQIFAMNISQSSHGRYCTNCHLVYQCNVLESRELTRGARKP